MRSIDTMVNGEYRGDGGVPAYIPQLPPRPAPIPVPTAIVTPPTGGPLPPTPVQTYNLQTGGPQQPVPVTRNLTTGGNQPPVMYTSPPPLSTGGNQPPVVVTPGTGAPNGNTGIVPPHLQGTNLNNFGPAQTVNDMIQAFINGPVAANARQRGLETASSRGLLNSSIAAGASQRAALESIQPYVSEGMNLLNSREQRALTQNESALERQFRQQLQNDSVLQQDWLANNAYNREFNGNLSLVPIANSVEFMQYLFQMGAQDPEVYTPNVLAGMQNFFTQNMLAMMQQFFPKTGGA